MPCAAVPHMAVVVSILLLAAACSKSPPPAPAPAPRPPATAAEFAAGLEQRLGSLPPVAGTWEQGDARSQYRAWFEHGQLAWLSEERSQGEYGRGSHQYYFRDGVLYYYRALENRTLTTGPAAGGSVDSRVEVEFNHGSAVRATRLAHEGEIRLDAAAVAAIVKHATLLAEAAADEYSAAKLTATEASR